MREAMEDIDVTAAAKVMSRLGASKGGIARAEALTPEQRQEIGRNAIQARWAKRKGEREVSDIPKATHEGILEIGSVKIPCAVLDTGQRLLTQSGFMMALGRARQAKGRGYYDADVNLPAFLTAKSLKPFISKELEVTSSQVEFKPLKGYRAYGYAAELLPKVCDVFLDAEEAQALTQTQKHIARRAHILIRGLAHVGIIALVDEATGYQAERDRDALHKILEAYISKELLPWTRKFPPEFYKQLFRLQGWQYSPLSVRRPRNVAQLTIRTVYDKLPPGVYEALTQKNPIIKDGRRRYKLFRHMTEDIGQRHLEMHLASVTTLMRISPDWKTFEKLLDKAFPTPNKIIQEEMEYGDGFPNNVIDIEAMIATQE